MNLTRSYHKAKVDEKIKHYQLTYCRLMLLTGSLFYPLVGYILLWADTTAIDYLTHRYIISGYFFLLFLLSLKVTFIKENIHKFFYSSLVLTTWWVIWMVAQNNFSFNYSMLLLTVIAVKSMMLHDRNFMHIYLISSTIIILLNLANNSIINVNPFVIMICIVIIIFVRTIDIYYYSKIRTEINNLNEELEKVNTVLEDKVQERTQLLEQKNKELESYFYIFSHDLKTPLRNIDSFTQLIRKNIQKERYDKLDTFGAFITQGVNRMESIINDLLTYGQMGLTQSKFERVNINELITETINTNFSSLIGKEASIKVDQAIPQNIFCDKKQMSLLFQNLIGNGLKYNNSVKKIVEIGGYETPVGYNFYVKDNGIGIEPKHKKQVFEMFKRLQTKDQYEGTGVGLAICKRIVHNHKGKISFDSNPQNGTSFNFTIDKNLN